MGASGLYKQLVSDYSPRGRTAQMGIKGFPYGCFKTTYQDFKGS